MRICIVSSSGGHLTEVRCLRPAYGEHDHYFVLNSPVSLPCEMRERTMFITHSERDWKFFLNLWEAWRILRRHRPDVILSTGAGPAVPFALVGRFLFGARIVFIETIARVSSPSVTGRIMYRLAHDFFYQWDSLARHFPAGRCVGPLL